MLSPPSFILTIIVERLILGGLWFHIKLDTDLFTWSTKPVRTLRTEEMKIIFKRGTLLIMVIFPKGIKSLEDQTLRHFSRATNFFSKLSEASASHEIRFALTQLTTRCCFLLRTVFTRLFISSQLRAGSRSPPKKEIQGFRWMFGTQDSSRYNYYVDNVTDSLSLSFAPHLSLTLLFAWWLAAVFMPWSTTLMIFSSSEVLEPNVEWDLSLLSACFILSDSL